jgi:hypothetical protein
MELLFTMRRINRTYLARQSLTVASFLVLLLCRSFADAESGGTQAWKEYSTAQKTQSVVGFIHCYRTAQSSKNAFAQSDIGAVIRMVDAALSDNNPQVTGNLILSALKKAPHVKPDKHAEKWEGPYGFNDGMWWRGADDHDKQAYVQGVFLCAEAASVKGISFFEKSVPAAVQKLNDWYLVSDEDWKDPRSSKRADVPVVVAMQKTGIISHLHSQERRQR